MNWDVIHGDCLDVMRSMEAESIDAIVTDPPYGLEFMGKEWDKLGNLGKLSHAGPTERDGSTVFGRQRIAYNASGNMRCLKCEHWKWSGTPCKCERPRWENMKAHQAQIMQQWHHAWAVEALRVAKPGAHLLAFGGTRTFHRLTCAIEDAGWEIRDCIMWVYAQGFPKSLQFGCKCNGTKQAAERDMCAVHDADVSETLDLGEGGGEVLQSGLSEQGAPVDRPSRPESETSRLEQPGVEGWRDTEAPEGKLQGGPLRSVSEGVSANGSERRLHRGAPPRDGEKDGTLACADGGRAPHRPQPIQQRSGEPHAVSEQRRTQESRAEACASCGGLIQWHGWGTALKPAWEPIIVAMKPLEGTFAENAQRHGVAGLNVDGCRIGTSKSIPASPSPSKKMGFGFCAKREGTSGFRGDVGRWPANLIHDGSEEVVGLFPQQTAGNPRADRGRGGIWSRGDGVPCEPQYGDAGSAARFFYTAKASRSERNNGGDSPLDNLHPCVKPVSLLKYLCKLVSTPKGGTILDPFCGSGTTGIGAVANGQDCILIDDVAEYCEIARKRLAAATNQIVLDLGG